MGPMIYSKLLALMYRARYGTLAELPEGEASALVLVADGVGGVGLCSHALQSVTGAGGGTLLVRAVPWGLGLGRWHADLTNVGNHRAGAAAVADGVLAWSDRHPAAPVYLVGKSGGTGIVVGALERLPGGMIESAVLLAPALSPGYDLAPALRAVRGELVVFWSPLDVVVLGAGTRLFGTIDRVRSVSAGMVGFRRPPGLDAEGRAGYDRLRQVRWHPEMATTGYLGGHVGPDSPAFLRKYVVPLFRDARAPEKLNSPGDQAHPTPRR